MVNDSRTTKGQEKERVFVEKEQGIQEQIFDKLAEWESEQKSCRLITRLGDLRFSQASATVRKAHKTYGC